MEVRGALRQPNDRKKLPTLLRTQEQSEEHSAKCDVIPCHSN